jgi:5-methylcytosine-specific restriction protein A
MADFDPGLSRGQILTNDEVRATFKCSGVGSMRRSRATDSLVLITGESAGPYRDRWEGDEFHFTGRGLKGDQQIDDLQNRTLAESNVNGVAVFLFDNPQGDRYVFTGRMKLAGEPYAERQPDEAGEDRRVWVFPLVLVQTAEATEVTGSGEPLAASAPPAEARSAGVTAAAAATETTKWWKRLCAWVRSRLGR